MVRKHSGNEGSAEPVAKRLDALIRLLIEVNDPGRKKKIGEAETARLLHSVGLTPSEIATILGKGSRTDIAKYLYSRRRGDDQ